MADQSAAADTVRLASQRASWQAFTLNAQCCAPSSSAAHFLGSSWVRLHQAGVPSIGQSLTWLSTAATNRWTVSQFTCCNSVAFISRRNRPVAGRRYHLSIRCRGVESGGALWAALFLWLSPPPPSPRVRRAR